MTTIPQTAATGYFAALAGEQFIVLTTYRASGTPVPTTVWFAEAGGKLYITTNVNLKKVGRIRANPAVQVAASDQVGNLRGTALAAQARVLEPAEFGPAEAALRAKYGQVYVTMTGQMDATQPPNSRIFLEVTPPC
ncbi:MAG: PPOX class F420-dependent oxidoreductase [Kouleothrix sp.]|jgi:PPOX class probable F420-dependent enzyme|nr:PPOX class F420-dependent oxidoreductase [Kouleothrix sp.]